MNQIFRIKCPCSPPVTAEVLEVWKVIKDYMAADRHSAGMERRLDAVDDVADPDSNLLIILHDCGNNEYICYFEGHYFVVHKALLENNSIPYMDVGYVFAPYVPMRQTPMVLSPAEAKVAKGIITRYGRKLLEAARGTQGT